MLLDLNLEIRIEAPRTPDSVAVGRDPRTPVSTTGRAICLRSGGYSKTIDLYSVFGKWRFCKDELQPALQPVFGPECGWRNLRAYSVTPEARA